VNYAAIENNYDDLDDELQEDQPPETEEPLEPSQLSPISQREKIQKLRGDEDEDASFNEEESDEFPEEETDPYESDFDRHEQRRRERQFISRDDDEEQDEEYDYVPEKKKISKQNSKRSARGRPLRSSRLRKAAAIQHDDEEEEHDGYGEEDTLEQELADLKNSSELDGSPHPRSLRQRTREVNYTIPPPLTENLDGLPETVPQPSPTRRRNNTMSLRRLFPTGGPFGGGDVTSIFGKNSVGLSSTPGNLLAGGADSDSSDDDTTMVKKSSLSAPVGIKSKKKDIADTDPLGVDMNVDFSNIGGLDNYINQLKEMVALPLLYPEVYQRFGITPPRGVLFHGPPGTGKTLMARALAASCSTQGQKITFFMRKGADCLSKWVGEAERQLRLLFEEAKKQQPSIIFFDEIDGLAPVRSSKQEQIHASIVSTMLALMDGMDNRGQVIVIGATNRPDAVDPALRRPGRFDREFYFPLPDLKAREEIIQIHTKKWDPPLAATFVEKIAHLTKGYGGADLRALCTEAALNSIQRRYPQIYHTNDKLKIDPSSIHVAARDFMKALDKIIPSSARSTSSGSAPLPDHLTSLLEEPLNEITAKLDKLVPRVKKMTSLEEAELIDPTENDDDGGFAKHELIKRLEASRVHRPRLLITGEAGNGQQYLGSAVLNHLEGFNVQSLDLGTIFGDSTRSVENAIIQSFVEARRHKPSIIFIPNIDIWYDTVPDSSKSTLAGLLRSISSNERILLLGVSDKPYDELDHDLKLLFGMSDSNYVKLTTPDDKKKASFFRPMWEALKMEPNEFLDNQKKKKLENLEKLELPKTEPKVEDLRAFEKNDMKLKNALKIKLSGLMDLFKNRYRKFRKPPIEDFHLIHLFEAPVRNDIPPLYSKYGDMIVETATGRKFFNMDLDIIEERLWNGFYSEPKQFLKDVEMIYLDAVTLDDRERLIKASEMYANAQVGVEEISTPEFIEQCRALRRRELQRIKKQDSKRETIEKEKSTADESLVIIEVNGPNEPVEVITETVESHAQPAETYEQLDDECVKPHLETILEDTEPIKELTEPVEESEPPEKSEPTEESVITVYEEPPSQETALTNEVEVTTNGTSVEVEDEHPPFVLDNKRLKKLRSALVAMTPSFSVELLEQVNAQLMDIIWEDRHLWDRSQTLNKLEEALEKIQGQF
jgi:SpoVK/Ycf46/Vps4 family AAA+-type ATPase